MGPRLRRPLLRHVRLRHRTSTRTGRLVLGRDRLGIKPLYLDQTPDRLRFASTLPALLAGGGTDTSIDLTALAYYMSFHCVVPAPRTILNGIRKLPPATVRVVEPDGRHSDTLYWEPEFSRDPDRADWTEQDWEEALLDSPADRGRPPDGGRRPGRRAAVRRHRLLAWSSPCWPRPARPACRPSASASTPPAASPATSSSTQHPGGRAVRHRPPPDPDRQLAGCCRASTPPSAAMSEPMVSHDCVAFYLLSQEVSAQRQGGAVRAGRGRGAGRLRLVPAAGRGRPGRRRRGVRERVLRPALAGDGRAADAGAGWPTTTRRPRYIADAVRPARARRPRWTRRCATTPRSCWSTTR